MLQLRVILEHHVGVVEGLADMMGVVLVFAWGEEGVHAVVSANLTACLVIYNAGKSLTADCHFVETVDDAADKDLDGLFVLHGDFQFCSASFLHSQNPHRTQFGVVAQLVDNVSADDFAVEQLLSIVAHLGTLEKDLLESLVHVSVYLLAVLGDVKEDRGLDVAAIHIGAVDVFHALVEDGAECGVIYILCHLILGIDACHIAVVEFHRALQIGVDG